MAINIGKVTIGNVWKSQPEVFNLIFSHLNRYPLLQIQDIYKLMYQGAIGHDPYNGQREFDCMDTSFETIPPDQDMPLWENIDPGGNLVRLHIAAYRARNRDCQALAAVSAWTKSAFQGSQKNLIEGWNTFVKSFVEKNIIKVDSFSVNSFSRWLSENKYPPVHHSRIFLENYHPAYCIVVREFLQILMDS